MISLHEKFIALHNKKRASILSDREALLINLIELQQDVAETVGQRCDKYKELQDTVFRQCEHVLTTEDSIIIKN